MTRATETVGGVEPPLPPSRQWRVWVVLAVVAASGVKLILALGTFGTNDVYRYEHFELVSRYLGGLIYETTWDFNHPPSVIPFLAALRWLGQATGLPFSFWLRLPGILADAASVLLVSRILSLRSRPRSSGALLALALCPVSILVSGFHGNTDAIVIMFVLLSVWLTMRGGGGWGAGIAFALSMCLKVFPVVVAPVLLLCQPARRGKLRFVAAAGAVLCAAYSPFVFQYPMQVCRKVLGYRSLQGIWGITWLTRKLVLWVPALATVDAGFREIGTWLALGGCVAAAIWMNGRRERPPVFDQVGVVFLLFLATTNGFGVQYLLWLVPWVAGLGVVPALVQYATSGLFLFSVYDYWCQGFPWYLADSGAVPDWSGYFEVLQLLAWLSTVLMLGIALVQVRRGNAGRVSESRPRLRWAWCAAGVAGLVFLVFIDIRLGGLQASGETAGERPGRGAIARIHAASRVELALTLYHLERFGEAVAVLDDALTLDPTSADAYNNRAVARAALHDWTQAASDAALAVRLKPDFQLARNNLAWIQEERAKASHPPPAGSPAKTPESLLDLSLRHFRADRWRECIAAAREALTLKPDMAEAYNNIAAGYAALGQWDEAIAAARQALRLKPDFPLAKNNLAWALDQQKKEREKASAAKPSALAAATRK